MIDANKTYVDMNVKLDNWKNKLLDMTKRNQLLNYRETKRSTLRFEKPNIYELWDNFVIGEEPLVFPLVNEDENSSLNENTNTALSIMTDQASLSSDAFEVQREDEGVIGETIEEDAISDEIVTNKSPKDQQAILRNLHSKAKQNMEERGVNVLYLSFGFLRWSEIEHSHEMFDAPLILVPVVLKWESIISPFVLELHEDENIVNPALAYKLDSDFHLKLPEFSMDEPLEDYFIKVEDMFANSNNNWQVIREVSLGTLSFLKINMYYDLENRRDEIINDPLIQTISGISGVLEYDLSGIDNYDFDRETKPEEVFQIVDADSSQQDAILCAKRGISFVLQGPPGTGKSQTITNIISECLADGKKVLFVSEKAAALDVVLRRLTSAGLADFCLPLHSHKADKKEVLNQLGDVLDLANKRLSMSDETAHKLDALVSQRTKLNDYSDELFEIIEPLHKNIYDAWGILSSLESTEDKIFDIPDVRATTAQQYRDYLTMLRELASLIKQTHDLYSNPWRGSSLTYISVALRQEIRPNANELMSHIDQLSDALQKLSVELSLTDIDTYHSAKRLLLILNAVQTGYPFLNDLILNNAGPSMYAEVDQCEKDQAEFTAMRSNLLRELQQTQNKSLLEQIGSPDCLTNKASIDSLFSQVQRIIKQYDPFNIWENQDIYNQIDMVCSQINDIRLQYNQLYQTITRQYRPEIFQIPYIEMYRDIQSSKHPNSEYKKVRKELQTLYIDGDKLTNENIDEILSLLLRMQDILSTLNERAGYFHSVLSGLYQGLNTNFNDINKYKNIFSALTSSRKMLSDLSVYMEAYEDHEISLKERYGDLYTGILTDWDAIRKALDWGSGLKEQLGDLSQQNMGYIFALSSDNQFVNKCRDYAATLSAALNGCDSSFEWFISMFDDRSVFEDMSFPDLIKRIKDCCDNTTALEEWIDYSSARKCCDEHGLGEYVDIIETTDIKYDEIEPIFKKRFFTMWIDTILPEHLAVANFRRRVQENTIEEFQDLDTLQLSIARDRVRYRLLKRLPSVNRFTTGADEVGILTRELKKQRRIMPLRKLFASIPNLIMTLKPCLMMSPLTVSLYLESKDYEFDTVIFDEASQVCTENAIGAICRGKQVIIAGDSKQLPPTGFFTATSSDNEFDDDDDDDESYLDAYESLLDEAALLPERTLLWHYRSRHEHLIAFSNAKIYQNRLVTFPSSVDRAPDIGVEYVYVPDGRYEHTGKKGNSIEAQRVAELVFDHFKRFPERSLGVVAFGTAQQDCIDAALRRMRQQYPVFETFFKEEGSEEPFFIKSLENVQGDERDTIIFSIGYAKDPNGVMRMNFGPLNQAGGERRLNVAISRAKYNVKLVGSIQPTDIDTSKVSNEGPKLLRDYIEFAIHGPEFLTQEAVESEGVWTESPFEDSVYDFLTRRGYNVATQVGCSGYRIDMAIKHPTLSGRYVLGIECDGASYHSARTARERDRLRQDVLEGMGWTIYRIWSTDWIRNRKSEEDRLIEAVENAITNYVEVLSYVPETPDTDAEEAEPIVFLTEEEKPVVDEEVEDPYGFEDMPEIDFSDIPDDRFHIIDRILRIIMAVYPVHFDVICQYIAPLLGREKVTNVVKQEVSNDLKRLRSRYVEKDQFYYPAGFTFDDVAAVPYRRAGNRRIQYISKEEAASGMLAVAASLYGATKDSLLTETARAFGFKRSGNNVSAAMEEAFNYLQEKNAIDLVNGKVVLTLG